MDVPWDPWEDNEIVQLWDQLDETAAAYVGISLLDVVVGLALLFALGNVINRIFPVSLYNETVATDKSPPKTKNVTESKWKKSSRFSTNRPTTEITGHMNPPPLGRATPQPETLQQDPLWIGEVTKDTLEDYTASKKNSRLLVAVNGVIYDVTERMDLYGEGKPYEKFAGRDVTGALAKWSLADSDLIKGDTGDLSPSEMRMLRHWESRFKKKYKKVGTLKPAVSKYPC